MMIIHDLSYALFCRSALFLACVICLPFPQESSAQVEAIYWVEHAAEDESVRWSILRADPGGRNVTTIYERRNETPNGSTYELGPVVTSDALDALFFVEIRDQHHISIQQSGLRGESPTTAYEKTIPFVYVSALGLLEDSRRLLVVEDADVGFDGIQIIPIDTGERLWGLDDPAYVFTRDLTFDPLAEQLYWARSGRDDSGIYRSDLDGSNITLLVQGTVLALALDNEEEMLYWSNDRSYSREAPTGIFRSNLDGSEIEHLVKGPSLQIGTKVVDGLLYWVDTETNTVYRGNADDLQNQGEEAEAIYVSEHKIYRPVILTGKRASSAPTYTPPSTVGVNVIPNPASDVVYATFEATVPLQIVVSLYTMIGARVGRVYSGRVYNGQRIELDVSHLARGTYLLHVRSETGEVISRVIVKR